LKVNYRVAGRPAESTGTDPYEIKNLASDTALTANLEAELETLIRPVNYTVPSPSHRLRVRSETSEFNLRTMSLL
jgi:hypothetical protein